MHGGEQSNCGDCHGEMVGEKVKYAYYHEAVSVAEAVRTLATSSKLPPFTDSFPEGRPELRWVFVPFFNQVNLVEAKDRPAPFKKKPGVDLKTIKARAKQYIQPNILGSLSS